MAMAQRIALMRAGRIEQIGDARQIYEEPVSRFAAEFIGEVNLFGGRIETGAGGARFVSADAGGFLAPLAEAPGVQGAAVMIVRPEHVIVSKERCVTGTFFEGTVTDYAYRGGGMAWRIDVCGKSLRAMESRTGGQLFERGERVHVSFDPAHVRIVPP